MFTLATGGGIAGAAASIAYAAKLIFDARKESKAAHLAEHSSQSGAVTDAATTNGILLNALKEERDEVQRLSTEVAALRKENTDMYAQLQAQRKQYEAEIQQLRNELLDLTNRLDDLRTRIKYGKLSDGPG